MVKRRAVKPRIDIRKWHEQFEWNGFERGQLVGVKGTSESTWTFQHAAVSNETGEVLWVTVYGGTGNDQTGTRHIRSFFPERIRSLTAAEESKRVNKAKAEEKKAAKAAEKPAQLRKQRGRKG